MHDRVAELRGLRAEHARLVQYSYTDRSTQVAEQLKRLRDELTAEADALDERAEEQAADGQDGIAAQTAAAARELRAELDQDAPATPKGRSATAGKRNTAAAKAPETT